MNTLYKMKISIYVTSMPKIKRCMKLCAVFIIEFIYLSILRLIADFVTVAINISLVLRH